MSEDERTKNNERQENKRMKAIKIRWPKKKQRRFSSVNTSALYVDQGP